jgi:transposase-like protein
MRCRNCQNTFKRPNESMRKTGFCKTCLPNIVDFLNGKVEALDKLEKLESI